MNTHLSYSNTPYVQGQRVQEALERLGIRHIRDNLPLRPTLAYSRRIAALAESGIRTQLTVGAAGVERGQSPTPLAEVMAALSHSPSFVAAVEAIEGPNEWDARGGDGWAPQVREYQCALSAAVRVEPMWAGVPVIAPSVARRHRRDGLGNLDSCADWGNNHTYVRGAPTVAEYTSERSMASSVVASGKPVAITETGYTNALREVNGKQPVSDAVASVYIPRLFPTAFEAGIARTFLYELLDERNDPTREDEEAHFGLLYHDLRPKPAYVALQRLLGLVTDTGAAGAAPSSFAYAVTGEAPDDVHDLLLSRRDGTLLLVLWRDVTVDPLGRGDDAVGVPVEVRFARPATQVDVHRPSLSGAPVTTTRDVERIRGFLGADVVVLRIDPSADGGAPMRPVLHADSPPLRVLEGSAASDSDAFAGPA